MNKSIHPGGRNKHDPRHRPMRTELFHVRLYPSEMEGLSQLAHFHNRTPGDQLRAILHMAIRHQRQAPAWMPPEMDAL